VLSQKLIKQNVRSNRWKATEFDAQDVKQKQSKPPASEQP